MSVLISIIIITFVTILISLILKKYVRLLKLSQNFIGPPALPIIGSALLFIGKPPEEYIRIIDDLLQKYGDTIKVWLGIEFNLLLTNPKDLEVLMTSTKFIEKADQYNYLSPWLREGLLLSFGKKWFQRRKIITPAFHFKILEQYVEIFDKQSNILVDKLKKNQPNDEINLFTPITLYTLDVICETAMGISVNAQHNSNSDYVQAVKTISQILSKRMFDVLYRYDFIFNLLPIANEQKRALKILHEFSENVIISRKEEILKEIQIKNKDINSNKSEVKQKLAFLDILIQSEVDGKPLSNLDIQEEVDTFIFEGHDTTASAIHFCLYNLACYQEAQQKCFEEIYEVFGNDNNKSSTYQDFSKLQYLEFCIKETLRLYPSVPLLGRKMNKECIINDKIIPKDTNIIVSPYHLGRSENIFPDPLKFVPERFDIEMSVEKMNPFLYIPFSAGPRNCIGQKFAMLEIKNVVSKILRNFNVNYVGPPEGPILLAELIMRPSNELKFQLTPRNY